MSSILDALNKLEDEKVQARAQAELDPADIDPNAAADELIGRSSSRESMTLRLSPVMLVGGAVAFLLLTVVVVVATVSFMMPPPTEPQSVASIPPTQSVVTEPAPEMTPAPSEEPPTLSAEEPPAVTPVEAALSEPVAAVAEPEPAVQQAPEPAATEPDEEPEVETTVSAPAPAPEPEPEPIVVAQAAPVLPEPTPLPELRTAPIEAVVQQPATLPEPAVATPSAPALNENIQAFPPFTVELQRKYGLDEFKINMLNPESETNPYGSAIINRKKVFESSYIEGNQVRLYKVDRRGIAVEVASTGTRYFVNF